MPSPAPQALGLSLEQLEAQGVLPKLDRGTDIRGPDANNNGVRDDIEAYIARLPLTDAQKRAAMQSARVQQKSLLMDLSNNAEVKALGDASLAATVCMGEAFKGAAIAYDALSLKIEAITANTPERGRRYMQYMRALSGTSSPWPEGNPCEP